MAVTIEWIRAAQDDEALFNLLSGELQRLLPKEVVEDRDLYHQKITSLPRGLRAMAGMHLFDVSMALDDLAWHFGNQNDERDLWETLNGLRELELLEIADRFEHAWKIMEPHLDALRSDKVNADNFSEWLESIGAQEKIDPMNDFIWAYSKQVGDLGLLSSWTTYARKHPEHCIVIEAES